MAPERRPEMTTNFDITCDADNVADRLESSAALLEWLSGELGPDFHKF